MGRNLVKIHHKECAEKIEKKQVANRHDGALPF